MSKNYKGSGAKPDNDISRELNVLSRNKTSVTVQINDDYRKYCSKLIEGIPITFLEFKQEWYRKNRSRKKFGKSKSSRKPQKIKI